MLSGVPRGSGGFTLLGLLVAIAIGAIVLTLGLPALQNMVARNRRVTSLDAMVNAVQTARSFAVSDGVPTTLCGSATGTSCDGQWSRGWIVVENRSGSTGSVGTGDPVVKRYPALQGHFTLSAHLGGIGYLAYRPSGLSNTGGYFTVCGPQGAAHAVSAIISPAGDVRSGSTTAAGGALSCP